MSNFYKDVLQMDFKQQIHFFLLQILISDFQNYLFLPNLLFLLFTYRENTAW